MEKTSKISENPLDPSAPAPVVYLLHLPSGNTRNGTHQRSGTTLAVGRSAEMIRNLITQTEKAVLLDIGAIHTKLVKEEDL